LWEAEQIFRMNDLKKTIPLGTIGLAVISILIMVPLAWVDYDWTLWLYDHRLAFLGEIMRRTVFEGSAFGASDPAIILQILVLAAYGWSGLDRKAGFFMVYRPYLGFVVFNSFVTGLGLVHAIKWMLGRARPYLVVKGELPYSHWFEFGPHFVTEGVFYGSFPSGHTATVFLLITFTYILSVDRTHRGWVRVAGIVVGGVTLGYTALMIIGRSMTLHHWLSDSIGIVCLAWISIHLSFFVVLQIPRQTAYIRRTGRYPPLPRYWEFQLLWRLGLLTLGVMGIVIGFRALWIPDSPWLIGLTIPAAPMVFCFGRDLRRLYRVVTATFHRTERTV
jgi:membrane-associated phospholipid phosphatase